MSSSQIDILPSYNINKKKWDACVNNSSNCLIYATSVYLDNLTDNWHGIVLNDYECVMPIAWRKKFGIRYCYTVAFIQQSGWFFQSPVVEKSLFIKALFKFCRYGDYAFNFENSIQHKKLKLCNNYNINLSQEYRIIKNNYRKDLINNLRKTANTKLIYIDETIEAAIELYKKLYSKRLPHITEKDYQNFYKVCKHLTLTDSVLVRKVCTPGNETLAVILLLKDKKRIYNLMNSTTATGRKTEANHFLIDGVLQEFSESGLLFDFEGSDIPGIKHFYESFGAVNQPYYSIHFNHLIFPFNLLK